MKVVFDITLVPIVGGGGTTMRKIIDLPFAPHVGMSIDSIVWKEAREIKSVGLSIDGGEPFAYAHMGLDEAEDAAQLAQREEIFKAHGWKKPSTDD